MIASSRIYVPFGVVGFPCAAGPLTAHQRLAHDFDSFARAPGSALADTYHARGRICPPLCHGGQPRSREILFTTLRQFPLQGAIALAITARAKNEGGEEDHPPRPAGLLFAALAILSALPRTLPASPPPSLSSPSPPGAGRKRNDSPPRRQARGVWASALAGGPPAADQSHVTRYGVLLLPTRGKQYM